MHLATRLDRYSPSCISIGPGHGRIPHSPTPIGIGPGAGENTAHYSAQGLPLPPRAWIPLEAILAPLVDCQTWGNRGIRRRMVRWQTIV